MNKPPDNHSDGLIYIKIIRLNKSGVTESTYGKKKILKIAPEKYQI